MNTEVTGDITKLLDSFASIGMARIKFDVNIGKLMRRKRFAQGKNNTHRFQIATVQKNFSLILQMKNCLKQ